MPRRSKYTNYRKRHFKNSPRQLGKKVRILEGKIRNKKNELEDLLAARLNGQAEDKKTRRQLRILPNIIEEMETRLIEKKKKLEDAKELNELMKNHLIGKKEQDHAKEVLKRINTQSILDELERMGACQSSNE
ncbi:21914_t:CDS:2 [Gigaspora margarita]|uniref:21914_t:CDS:1 n=1 Tax=Gigaspora margarita TaxID=4874 RepID=A0ABM8W502_GIGMA|nr:21914_t:CDS:2 [Gigaspora margarita]